MDFDNYKVALTIRSICLAERLLNKHFDKFTDGDALQVVYCSIIANNSLKLTFDAFCTMVNKNIKVARWVAREYEQLSKFMGQFDRDGEVIPKTGEVDGEDKDLSMSVLAGNLIIKYGMDAHYVMDEMQLWEIAPYMEVADAVSREEWEKERLFTFLTMSPHINTKKVKKPEQILPLPWDKSDKEKAENKISKDMDIINMILKPKEKKEDGEIGTDTGDGHQRLGGHREIPLEP